MSFKIIFLEEFGKAFVPTKFIPGLRNYMMKAGMDEVPYKFFGMLFYASALITTLIFVAFIYPYLRKFQIMLVYLYSFASWFVIQITFVTLAILPIYFYLDLKIYFRTKKMAEQPPDFLQIVSANLKGGMTFDKALWLAVKPRFNVLGSEMARASKKVMTGYELSHALMELADQYNSLMLRRTVDLIISEAESGGNISELIDRIVENLKDTKSLKEDLAASGLAYIIFISVIVLLISPLLFALSYNLLVMTLGFVSKLSFSTKSITNLPLSFTKVNINPGDFKFFSIVAIFTISLFSSMIVSIVEKGDIKAGVKYIPIFMTGSIAFYFLFMKVLSLLFLGAL